MASRTLGTAIGSEKLKAVTELVRILEEDVTKKDLQPPERNEALEELKIYGRDPRNADPIFAKSGITMLCAQVTNNLSDDTRQAALKVLANSMLLKEETRQMVIDFGLPPTACHGLTYETWDDEFLTSRVIFFCTYTGTLDLESLIDEHHLAEHIIKKLERHDSQTAQDPSKPRAAMQDMALAETLKLLFNVTYYCKQRISSFHGAIGPITSLGSKLQFSSSKPLDPPIGLWINALLNLNLDNAESQSILYTGDGDSVFYKRLVDILEAAFQAYTDDEVDTVITPPITLVAKLYETAPEDVKTYFKTRLLPSSADREKVLGSGDSLPARLLRKSTNPAAMLRNIILELFYNMSDRDAAKFVQNVGYGYASGFLFQNNVPIPESAREAFSTDNGNGAQRDINPITGQFLDREPTSDLPEMTDEEKEREAERLFVLFERLRSNGVINVENPVATAVREGKFRELGDDDVEELE